MFQSRLLDDLGHRYKTDKRSGQRGHDFLRKYEFFLRPFKDLEFTLLELGVYKGASLRMWADYFPQAKIVGVDNEPQTVAAESERIQVILGDLAQLDFLQSLTAIEPSVIIDDASHWWPDQLRAFFALYPYLETGGVYIMEDIHTSFPPLDSLFKANFHTPPFVILQKLAEYLTGNEKPCPILKDQNISPISAPTIFHEDIMYLAQETDAVVFFERACLLIKK
ncbi:MAG: class I SAM-dependent methyltransferase [Deltaproteobacteria bacterium]|jgi:SAM-dependent methyltransferase|nr:class I SAM-dependent methyltransferase [Deltaproteobacteria bacterium]